MCHERDYTKVYPKLPQLRAAGLGLTQTDAIQGAQTKWNELYEQYYERHFVQGNEEECRFRKSY
jgi:hypothetical protein